MSTPRLILLYGIIITLLPFIGVPTRWFRFLLPLFGLLLITHAFGDYIRDVVVERTTNTKQPTLFTKETKENSPESSQERKEETEKPTLENKYMRLAALMMGEKFKQHNESERLNVKPAVRESTRWSAFKKEEAVQELPEEPEPEEEVVEVLEDGEQIEVLIDDETVVEEVVAEAAPEPEEEVLEVIEDDTPLEELEEVHNPLNASLLARIGDEIEE